MSLVKKHLRIDGMTCINCQNKIEEKLRRTVGVRDVSVNYTNGTAKLSYDTELISYEQIVRIIEEMDYHVLSEKERLGPGPAKNLGFLTVIIFLYAVLEFTGILNLLVPGELAESSMGYGMLFVIGLFTSVHCIAMCGGINLSQCIPGTVQSGKDTGGLAFPGPAFLYNLGRVVSYTAIGFVLGAAGRVIGGGTAPGMPLLLQGALKIIAGVFMVIMGINMLGLFPSLRKFTIRMPGAVARKVRQEKARSRRPFYVGLLNGIMPCGPLQSMWIVAFISANPVSGALSMFCFSIGTVPLMLGLGSLVSALGKRFAGRVMEVGSVLVVVLGLAMLTQGLSLSGIPVWNLPDSSLDGVTAESAEAVDEEGVQVVNSTLSPGRFPNITVQAGIPVKWIVEASEGSINGCNYKIRIPAYDLEYTFQTGENVIEFTPKESGTVPYSCWMGMIRGNIFVMNSAESEEGGTTALVPEEEITVPVPAGYVIPSKKLAVAEESEAGDFKQVTISLTDQGFSPAVIVVEKNTNVVWYIQSDRSGELLAPAYSTKLPLVPGNNGLSLIPLESFEVSTDDHAFYAYVKVVDDLDEFDEDAVRKEVSEFETLIYPDSVFEASGMSCCQ